MATNPKNAQEVEIQVGDIEIGAVEIKNSGSDLRATVGANGLHVDVQASVLPTGASTSAAQTTGNASLTSIDGKITACNTGAVTVSSSALPSGAATDAKQDTGNSSLATIAGDTTSIDGKITACNTGAVTVSSSALPSGAATESTLANQVSYAATPTVYNVAMALADTEYSQVLPANTKKFLIKLRSGTDVLKVKFGAAGNYITIPAGGSYSEDNLKMASQTIYFESPTVTMTAEIVAWV